MKRYIKIVLCLVAIPLASASFTFLLRYAAAHWLGYVPVLQCPRTIDLGEWNTNEVAIGHFRIKNSGKRTLIVENFLTGCSCVVVEREIQGHPSQVQTIELSPGEEAELTVRFGISAPPGESQSVEISFAANDPDRPVWHMNVIIPRVGGGYFAQPSAVLFGTVMVGDETHRTIDLFNNRVFGRQVESVRSTHPDRFTVKLLPLSEVDKTRTHPTAGKLFARIEITPCSQQPGPITGEVYVSLAKEKHRTPPISVLGEVVNSIACRPAMLVLPRRVHNQLIRSGDILIFHRHEKPIDIALDSLPPDITAEVQTIEGRSDQRWLHIEWHPAARSKDLSARQTRLHLRIRADGKETMMEVPVFLAESQL